MRKTQISPGKYRDILASQGVAAALKALQADVGSTGQLEVFKVGALTPQDAKELATSLAGYGGVVDDMGAVRTREGEIEGFFQTLPPPENFGKFSASISDIDVGIADSGVGGTIGGVGINWETAARNLLENLLAPEKTLPPGYNPDRARLSVGERLEYHTLVQVLKS
jgi:hypothetical protein